MLSSKSNRITKKTSIPRKSTKEKKESYVLSDDLQKYLAYASKFNLLEGTTNNKKLSVNLVPLMKVAHKVIAGAAFDAKTGKVTGQYETMVAKRLDTMLNKAVKDIGKLGPRHGGDCWFE